MRAAALLSCALWVAVGCKSAEEKCEEARVSAEHAWQAQVDAHTRARKASVAAQAEAKTKLLREVEPRLSAAAIDAATKRYDRGTDAWLRAFQASQNSLCASDPDCAQLTRENVQAQEDQVDLAEKIATEQAALSAIRKTPDAMKQAAAAVIPDVANPALGVAKQASEAAYTECKDVKPAPPKPLP